MKFRGLDGRDYNTSVNDYKVIGSIGSRAVRSSYHLKARTLIQEKFKGYQIMEEMKIRGANLRGLYLDFYVPNLQLAVEVNGRQHYEFVKHFHKGRQGWIDSLKRDRLKREWCELNDIQLITFKYSEEEIWESQIDDR